MMSKNSISYIVYQLQATENGRFQISWNTCNERVKKLDKVAYIRFASIYLKVRILMNLLKKLTN